MWWLDFKTGVVSDVVISRDALHIFGGVGVHLLLVLAFRSWFGAIWPVMVIALLGLGNEWLDLTQDVWPEEARDRQWWESVKDMVTTLLIPVLLLALSRLAPGRFSRPEPGSCSEGPAPDAAAEVPLPPDSF